MQALLHAVVQAVICLLAASPFATKPWFGALHKYVHAWLGSLAGQVALPVAEVHRFCMASCAVFAVSSVDTTAVMTRPARWLVVMVPKRFAWPVTGTICSGLIA